MDKIVPKVNPSPLTYAATVWMKTVYKSLAMWSMQVVLGDEPYKCNIWNMKSVHMHSSITVDSEIFARILFSRIALKDILVMCKIRD